jgi:hypothetical protein
MTSKGVVTSIQEFPTNALGLMGSRCRNSTATANSSPLTRWNRGEGVL